jgi:hypothetical protein
MAWKATAMLAVALPTSFLAAVPGRRGGEVEEVSSPEELRSLLVLEVEDVDVDGEVEAGACGPMGITPVKTRFEAARASRVRARVRQR